MIAEDLPAALDHLDPTAKRLISFARELVATPSLSGEERPVAERLAAELEHLGYRDVEIDDVGNVVAWLGHGPPRLMFNGHIDHVPIAGMDDAFSAEIVDAARFGEHGPAISGRGSCDMKANVAAGAFAAAFIDPAELERASYLFVADVQEETDSPVGVPALVERGIRADFGVSGESTGLAVSVGHRGKVQFDVIVSGRSSHASTPGDGVNAVFGAVPFLLEIERMADELPDNELYGAATITVTGISSEPTGDVAVVPSQCAIRVDRRYVPGETPTSVQRMFEERIARVSEGLDVKAHVEVVNVYPLMAIDDDHELVRTARHAVEAITGEPAVTRTWRFGVNATFMSAAGIPTIGIGPGNETWAHTPDEHVPVDEVVIAARMYAKLFELLVSEGISA